MTVRLGDLKYFSVRQKFEYDQSQLTRALIASYFDPISLDNHGYF